MRGKTCGGWNTSMVNYATAAMRMQSLWWLKYKRGKLCNWCHARQKLWRLQAREYLADAKRENTRKLPMQTYSLFHEWEARSCFDMFVQNCLDLGECVMDSLYQFFHDELKLKSLKVGLKRFRPRLHYTG